MRLRGMRFKGWWALVGNIAMIRGRKLKKKWSIILSHPKPLIHEGRKP
jgi:hypothetical protein